MSVQNIFLVVAAGVNLIMSILVFSRGVRNNKINLYFSLLTFFNVLWAVGLIITNAGWSIELSRFFASFIYPIAMLVVIYLYFFIYYFPYKIGELSRSKKYFIYISIAWSSIFCIFFYRIFVSKVVIEAEVFTYFEFWSYTLYTINLLALMLLGILLLIRKYKMSEGIYKNQLRWIMVAVILGIVTGVYFNLVAMYFSDLSYNHLGPLFTLLINFVAFYFIFLSKINIVKK